MLNILMRALANLLCRRNYHNLVKVAISVKKL